MRVRCGVLVCTRVSVLYKCVAACANVNGDVREHADVFQIA